MNPLRLTAENYRSFRELALDFPDGLTAIVGENGAGKSSIVNAIELALFGGRLASQMTEGEETMRLALVFEHGGETYTIERGYSAAGRGKTTLVFARDTESLNRESTRATQERIENEIGFTRDTWRASAFLAQGDGAAFTEAEPRERKAILAEAVLGRDPIWPKLVAAARSARIDAETKKAELDGAISRAAAELLALPDLMFGIPELEVELEDVSEKIRLYGEAEEQLRERVSKIETHEQERRALGERQLTLQERLSAYDETEREASKAVRALVGIADELAVASKLAAEAKALREAQAEYRVVAVQRKAAQIEYDRLQAQVEAAFLRVLRLSERVGAAETSPTCETCGQPLNSAARQRTAETLQERMAEAVAERDALVEQAQACVVPDIGPPPAELSVEQEEAEARLPGLLAARQTLTEAAERPVKPEFKAQRKEARDALAVVEDEAAKVTAAVDEPSYFAARAELTVVADKIVALRAERDQLTSGLAVARSKQERLTTLKAQWEADLNEREAIENRMADVTILERAYSQGGIPALLIENTAIPQIEAEANRILGELGGVAVGVQLHTQRERKSGDGLSDALDIVVSTETGQRDYQTLSGGERSRVNVALRVALAALLAGKRGAESQLLVIDEPDGLDQAGFSALLDVLGGLADTFSKILVVSHHPELRDSIEQTIRLAKHDGRSEVQA